MLINRAGMSNEDYELDGIEFNPFCTELWKVMRDEFPAKPKPETRTFGETESVESYIHRHRRRWQEDTGNNPDKRPFNDITVSFISFRRPSRPS